MTLVIKGIPGNTNTTLADSAIEMLAPAKSQAISGFLVLFWLMPLLAVIFRFGHDWSMAALIYLSMISGTASTIANFKKGFYIYTA
jgi:hypothetical protein